MNTKERIFIVDDEPQLVKIATKLLSDDGYSVDSAFHPTFALKKISAKVPDLVLLDIRLPDMDGLQVCKKLKSDPQTAHIPIIMLSVKSDETDVVLGLELGADDYIPKPYRKHELLARVRAALRKSAVSPATKVLEKGPLRVDLSTYKASMDGESLRLTPKELELLGFFLRNEDRFVSRSVISEALWGSDISGSSRTVDVHVKELRKKLGRCGGWIKSLRGVGYRLETDLEDPKDDKK